MVAHITKSETLFRLLHRLAVVALILEEVDIDKDGSSHQETLLLRSRTWWEGDIKGVGFSKNFHSKRLGCLEDFSNVGSIAVRLLLAGREDMERNLATTPSEARISFRATVDAAAGTACWRVNLVKGRAVRRHDLEGGDAEETILLHAPEFLSTRCNRSLLVAATLASAKGTAEWAVDGDHLGLRVEFLLGRVALVRFFIHNSRLPHPCFSRTLNDIVKG